MVLFRRYPNKEQLQKINRYNRGLALQLHEILETLNKANGKKLLKVGHLYRLNAYLITKRVDKSYWRLYNSYRPEKKKELKPSLKDITKNLS